MSNEPEKFEDLLSEWFKGDENAINFAICVWEACQAWDDIEDEGSSETSNEVISFLAFGKEYHPFFAPNNQIMRPALLSMYLKWTAANVLDLGTETDVEKSYMLRAGFYDVLHLMTWIIGGDDWAVKCGPAIYRSYGETLADLKKEFA